MANQIPCSLGKEEGGRGIGVWQVVTCGRHRYIEWARLTKNVNNSKSQFLLNTQSKPYLHALYVTSFNPVNFHMSLILFYRRRYREILTCLNDLSHSQSCSVAEVGLEPRLAGHSHLSLSSHRGRNPLDTFKSGR